MIELKQFGSEDEVFRGAAKVLRDQICASHDPVLLLSSGGSALRLLDFLDDTAISAIDTLSMLDERFSRDHRKNNFMQLAETSFYKRAIGFGVTFLPSIPYQHEDLDAFAARFKDALQLWLEKHPRRLVVGTLGIGIDGHTAGIFPKNPDEFEEFFERDPVSIGYVAENASVVQERVTVTLPFLRTSVDTAVLVALGEEKREALQRATTSAGSLSKTPARIVQEMKDIVICTDSGY